MLQSILCDYKDPYILVTGNITVLNTVADSAAGNNASEKVIFKHNCISKINNTLVNNAKDIDIVMPLYNLIEYNSKTFGSLQQYCEDIPAVNNNGNIVECNGANGNDSFDFKAKITGQTGKYGTKEVKIIVPLKYLSNFWRTLEMPLIHWEINLILNWSTNCVIVYTNVTNPGAAFEITDTKLYIPDTSTQDNAKLLQQLKSGFKKTINWNKDLSKPEFLAQNPNLNHLIEPSVQD